jgi:hypothetical protein
MKKGSKHDMPQEKIKIFRTASHVYATIKPVCQNNKIEEVT